MPAKYNPRTTKIKEIAKPLCQYLFNNPEWELDYKGMVTLLNIISNNGKAPNPYKIPYGQPVLVMVNIFMMD